MSQLTRPTLSTAIDASFPDNTTKLITESILRTFLHNLLDSAYISLTDGTLAGILLTVGAPQSGLGSNGNFAMDPIAKLIYGPKTNGTWPAGVSFQGTVGQGVSTGGAINQVLAKNSSTDYDTHWVDQQSGGAGVVDTPETIAVTGAGSSPTARPAGVTSHLVKVNVGAGSVPYVFTLTPDSNNTPNLGTKMVLLFTLPSSINPTINVALGAGLIVPITNPSGLAGQATIVIQYNGSSSWIVIDISDGTSADEMRFTIASAAPGATFLCQLERPFLISSWNFVGNTTGSIAIGLRKASSIGGLASIVASLPPSVTGQQTGRSTTLTGWTTQLNAGDFLEVSVTSSSGYSNGTFTIGGTR